MRNKFFRKVFLGLASIMVFGIIATGCGAVALPTTPVIPTTYTVTVVSQHAWCYGTVYVAGAPTSSYLLTWGSATVYNVPSGAAIYLVDTAGFQSHTEYFNPASGTTIVFNYWW
jgi:hypothetical protein